MNIFFGSLCAIVWMCSISNCFTIGIHPIRTQELTIISPQPTPSPKNISNTKTKDQRGIETVISMLIEMQQMVDMLNPSLDNKP